MAYPRGVKVPLPEIGKDAWMLIENPWMMPPEPPYPTGLDRKIPVEGVDPEEWEYADPEGLFAENERRGKERFNILVLAWEGVYDIKTGDPLPPPSEDPDVFDRAPMIVFAKLQQAIAALQLDHEWDPTRRPEEPPTPPS